MTENGTTLHQLLDATEKQTMLLEVQEVFKHTRFGSSPQFRIVDDIKYNVECDEVYPNLFVGDLEAAGNLEYLNKIGITHVVNMAEGDVYTDASYYKDTIIQYLGKSIVDWATARIDAHFENTSKFIQNGIKTGGKVLVHCYMGFSRSATIAIAYLMMCEGMSAVKACRTVRENHLCRPNDGFLQQLVDLDNKLKTFVNTTCKK